ncbi:MAG: DNA-3-methyladenine glycosylase I [Chloroflexi bacterium]|nr:DNA-3-methyladenine glycosylase I [Chloroflexota bacterium]
MTYEIPPRQRPQDDNGYLEHMTKAVFQAGFSWKVIGDKWPNFQQAFDGFDVEKVADYDTRDVDRLLADESIVRNGRKIEATIHNAGVMQELIAEHGSFYNYLRSLDDLDYAGRRKELRQRFSHLGPTGIFVFLWYVDEDVPDWEERNL